MKLLCVEDDPISLKFIIEILDKAGYETLSATSVAKAISLLESISCVELIISDIMMPDQDGYDLLRYLKANIKFKHIPVIMATASDDQETVVKCVKLGAKDYIVKPVNRDLLIQKAKRILKSGKRTVLVVNDEQPILEMLSNIIDREGFKTYQAQSGIDALKTMESNCIDIVFSDIQMQGMTGLELLSKIKDKHPHVKVVLVTGYATKYNHAKVSEQGADGFITKPLKNIEIIDTLKNITFQNS